MSNSTLAIAETVIAIDSGNEPPPPSNSEGHPTYAYLIFPFERPHLCVHYAKWLLQQGSGMSSLYLEHLASDDLVRTSHHLAMTMKDFGHYAAANLYPHAVAWMREFENAWHQRLADPNFKLPWPPQVEGPIESVTNDGQLSHYTLWDTWRLHKDASSKSVPPVSSEQILHEALAMTILTAPEVTAPVNMVYLPHGEERRLVLSLKGRERCYYS